MAVSDPIADMLIRIKNALRVRKAIVALPSSKMKMEVLSILTKRGFIAGFKEISKDGFKEIEIELRYESDGRTPVITEVSRISKPGRRVYSKKDDIPRVMQGRGVIVMSTSKGIMSGDDARKKGLGGEVLLKTW